MEINPEIWWVIGLFWAFMLGWAGSSYLSNFINRLPAGEAFFDRKPYCGNCQTALQPIDLAPILSYLLTGGKCRYCKAPVPLSYFLVELLYPLFSALYYVQFGFGSEFLILWLASGLLLVMFFAALQQDFISRPAIIITATLGLFVKTLSYQSVLDGILHGFIGLFIGMAVWSIWKKKANAAKPSLYNMPASVWMLATASLWLRADAIIAAISTAALAALIIYTKYRSNGADVKALLILAPTLIAISFWGY